MKTVRLRERVERFAPLRGLGRVGVGARAAEHGGDVRREREIGHVPILARSMRTVIPGSSLRELMRVRRRS